MLEKRHPKKIGNVLELSVRTVGHDLLECVQREQTLGRIVLYHLDDDGQEVMQVSDSDVTCSMATLATTKCVYSQGRTCSERSSSPYFFLLSAEAVNGCVEDILLRRHVAAKRVQL